MNKLALCFIFAVGMLAFGNCMVMHKQEINLIFHHFSSNNVPVSTTYDSMISIFGNPLDRNVKASHRLVSKESEPAQKYFFEEIHFPDQNIAYIHVGDSVELLYVLFEGPREHDTINYNNYHFCRTTNMNDVADCFGLDSANRGKLFHKIGNADYLSNIASYSFMYFGVPYEGYGYVEFFFGEDGLLLEILFSQLKGSIVYRDK